MVQALRLTRRSFLKASGGAAVAATLPPLPSAAAGKAVGYRITAKAGQVPLVGAPHPETRIWGYEGQVPGPVLRVRQGECLRVAVENLLEEETTVHWHGVRVPNAMDGVPHLTQKPIAPGETFLYEFDVPDAGTYWYPPHQRGFAQVRRHLPGAPTIEQHAPAPPDERRSGIV